MKISKEVKIGILVSLSILIFFAGFYYLKGSNIFSSQNRYFCYYGDVNGLQVSANVQVHGMNVGRVSNIELAGAKGVKVTVAVDKSIEVNKGTVALLASADLISGTKVIKLNIPAGIERLGKGAEIQSAVDKSFLDNIGEDISPVVKTAKIVMAELDSVVSGVQDVLSEENKKAITKSMSSIQSATNDISVLASKLRNQSATIENILHNSEAVTTNLASTSKQIANAPIQKTVEDMQATVAQLHEAINKINHGDGSIGLLINDKTLYNNLNASLGSMDKLLADLKAHPSRYINLTIFGKKKKE